MHETPNPYASPHERSEQVDPRRLRTNVSPPGFGFWLMWVAASVVCTIVRSMLQTFAAGALAGNTQWSIVVALLVLDPITGLLSGVMHWVILSRWLQRTGWWVLATAVAPLAVNLTAALVYWLAQLTDAAVLAPIIPQLGIALGGAVVGTLQWLVLRGRVRNAGWWIAANSISYGVYSVIRTLAPVGLHPPIMTALPANFLGSGFLAVVLLCLLRSGSPKRRPDMSAL